MSGLAFLATGWQNCMETCLCKSVNCVAGMQWVTFLVANVHQFRQSVHDWQLQGIGKTTGTRKLTSTGFV